MSEAQGEVLSFAMLFERSGLTQTELAEIVDVRRATVSGWVSGKTVPTLPPLKLKKLLTALNCSLEDLVSLYHPEKE